MKPDFSRYDLSGREPRDVQKLYLEHLSENWDKADVHVGILPVGAGKSMVARSIQVTTGADIMTVSNPLVMQYSGDYPMVNVLKGKSHYKCSSGMTCKDWCDAGFDACPDCPYQRSKAAALAGADTFYNPMSFYYLLLQGGQGASTLVLDEAHSTPGMVNLLSGKRFKRSDYNFSEKCCNELSFIQWGKDQIRRLTALGDVYYRRKDFDALSRSKEEIENLSLTLQGVEEDPQNYVFYIDKDKKDIYLNVKPIFPPRFLMDRIVGGKKLILMSGTLFDHDIADIAGDRSIMKYEAPSPIPVENRKIYYRPAPFAINYQTNPKALAELILSHIDRKQNTMVHVSYSWAKKLIEYFPAYTISNTPEDKEEKIEEFKQRGGIFLAAGCAEGVDFKGNYCRLNIISKINFPDMGDPVVKKRKAMQDGDTWYALTSLKTLIQQAGRSTRGPDDYSKTIVLDPMFKPLVKKYAKSLPKYFLEACRG